MTHAHLRGVAVGAGYFSQFHFDAWQRTPETQIVALCDLDASRAHDMALRFGIPRVYADAEAMLDAERPDFVDIITPPETHRALCATAGAYGAHVLCQKALAPTAAEAVAIVREAEEAGIRVMVHDNFRFQPWHREIRRLVDGGAIGEVLSIATRTRMGDGWQEDAYVSRQPYFRTMPRLLIFETGVHFIDVFRFLSGSEVQRAFALVRQRNPAIAGEDAAIMLLELDGGATALWDASRYHESLAPNPRYTFGEFLIEGERGAIRLAEDGSLSIQTLGESPVAHGYSHEDRGFAGDCCHAAIQHFVDGVRHNRLFETEAREYLKTLIVQEAVYEAAATGTSVTVASVARALEI